MTDPQIVGMSSWHDEAHATDQPMVTRAEHDALAARVAAAETLLADHRHGEPEPTPDPEPDPEPVPEPPPEPGAGPSGIAVPTVKTGWRRVGFSHFDDNIPHGSWTGDPQGVMMGRASGVDTSKRGTYRLSEISQHDSLLDSRMRRTPDGLYVMGCPMNKAPNPSNDAATAPLSLRVTECMKVLAPAPDFKIAHMVAKYGVVRSQEIDHPETRLNSGSEAHAWLHLLDGGSGKHFASDASIYDWHTYTIEFVSGHHVIVEIDGKVLGRNDNASLIGKSPVHWIIQNETAIGVALGDGREAHVLIDWVTIDVPA
jgi:hypothetical protein